MLEKKGVLSTDYHDGRKNIHALKYRLTRRTDEVLQEIKTHKGTEIDALCDIGTADGMMLDTLTRILLIKTPVGLDYSDDLLRTNTNSDVNLVRGDAVRLPLKDNSFDIAVATAVIEHVPDAGIMIEEFRRILREEGICILSTPDPFFENIATCIGHLGKEQHIETFNLPELVSLLKEKNFKILKAEKFMMSPVGFPFEKNIEKLMKFFKLGFFLLNQLVVAQKLT
ncbi:class I SAM-dependent methyltransferase [Chloroflexota bacterium]